MIIRTLREKELAALLRLYALLHPEDPRLDPELPQVSRLWRQMSADPHIRCYVAESDGDIVSTCTLTIILNLTRNARPYGLIENVFTEESFRRRGIASALLRRALTKAWDAGCYKVMLFTGSRKKEVLHFYEQAGFRGGIKTGFIAYPDQREPRP
jgi:GNAT superfamily N-acetyltransferase